MYNNYIFDLYGTLVDVRTNEEKDELWNKMAMLYGYYEAHYTPEELKEKFIKTHNKYLKMNSKSNYPEIDVEDIFYKLFKDKKVKPKNKVVKHAARTFRLLSTEHIKLYDNVIEVLETLKKKNKKIYILTNAQRAYAIPELKLLNIKGFFNEIYISSEFGYCSPEPKFFNKIIEEYKLKLENTIMISNDVSDIEGAKAVGLDGMFIQTNLTEQTDLNIDCKHKILDGDIKKVLDTLA